MQQNAHDPLQLWNIKENLQKSCELAGPVVSRSVFLHSVFPFPFFFLSAMVLLNIETQDSLC